MATKTVTNLTAVISANNTKFKKGISGSQKILKNFQSQVMSIGPAIAASFSVAAIKNFTQESIRAYDVQAQAEKSLLVALNGRKSAQQALIKQAQDLQKVTLFGDEETIRAQALIAAFVDEEEQIKKVIPLVQDLATAKGMDLAGAADLVSKTLGSSTNALSRYGIQVEGSVGSVERLESLMQGLNDAFGGQAEAAAQTGMGAITQFQNVLGDFKEQVGRVIIEMSDLNEVVGNLSTIIGSINADKITEADNKFQGLSKTLRALNSPLKILNEYNKWILGQGAKLIKRSEDQSTANTKEAMTWDELVQKGKDVVDFFKDFEEQSTESGEAVDEFTYSVTDANAALKALEDNFISIHSAHDEFMKSVGSKGSIVVDVFDLGEENLDNEDEEVDGLIETWNREAAAAKQLESDLTNAFTNIGVTFAESMGQVAAGTQTMEDALKDISAMILGALGDILIAAGLSTSPIGVPLILAGLAAKGFSSFASAKIGSGDGFNLDMPSMGNFGADSSVIYGNDIKTSNDYYVDKYNRVG